MILPEIDELIIEHLPYKIKRQLSKKHFIPLSECPPIHNNRMLKRDYHLHISNLFIASNGANLLLWRQTSNGLYLKHMVIYDAYVPRESYKFGYTSYRMKVNDTKKMHEIFLLAQEEDLILDFCKKTS